MAFAVPLALAVLGVVPTFAEDASIHHWSGPYVGTQVGFESATMTSVTTNLVETYPVPFRYSFGGAVGGVHVGYNQSLDSFVVGIEGGAEASSLEGRQPVNAYQVTYTSKTSSDFDASIRLRSGLALDQFLLYGTEGVAWQQVKIAYSCSACVSAAGATDTLNNTRVGWTAGAGTEYGLNSRMSLNLEYRYADLGSKRLIDPFEVADYHQNHFTSNTVRLGFSIYLLR